MPASLFIEHHPDRLTFYINGDLQFDTVDEAIYHEHLVVPAIALAAQRFPDTPLRVLICGGGDGLAARDVLRFAQVGEVTLVDYNPEVLELGRTVFRPYNRGSLVEERHAPLGASRVTVHTQDAFEFISRLPDACYHAIICDFTFPNRPEDAQIYTLEWFRQVKRVLHVQGVMSTNAVSPDQRTLGFWCLYQTLFAAGLHPKPLQVYIPSFHRHGYGDWGFLLASPQPITRLELETLEIPDGLHVLQANAWLQGLKLQTAIAQHRHQVAIHTLDSSQLLYYLLNPQLPPEAIASSITHPFTDFLDLQEVGTGIVGTSDLLQLDALAKFWLEQLRHTNQGTESKLASSDVGISDLAMLDPLIPVQHRYHSPMMTREWLGYLRTLLAEIDLQQLIASLLERAQELPPQLVRELKQLAEKTRTGQPLTYISEHTAELVTILAVTLIMANLTAPDAVFAKGFYGSRSHSSGSGSSSSSCYYDSYGTYTCDSGFGWLGLWTMIAGGMWLYNLYKYRDE
jgi:spermidine synthase